MVTTCMKIDITIDIQLQQNIVQLQLGPQMIISLYVEKLDELRMNFARRDPKKFIDSS